MLKYKDKVLHILVNILMFIVIIAIFFVGYHFIQLKVMDKDFATLFGYTTFEVTTGSMGKAVEKDDVIIVKVTKDVQVGDIITYQSGKDFITHRVKEIRGNYLITKGDSNNAEDAPISKTAVVGKVVKVLENVGLWKKILQTPKVTISILITLLLFGYAFSTKTESPQKKEKRRQKKQKRQEAKVIKLNQQEEIEVIGLEDEQKNEDIEII